MSFVRHLGSQWRSRARSPMSRSAGRSSSRCAGPTGSAGSPAACTGKSRRYAVWRTTWRWEGRERAAVAHSTGRERRAARLPRGYERLAALDLAGPRRLRGQAGAHSLGPGGHRVPEEGTGAVEVGASGCRGPRVRGLRALSGGGGAGRVVEAVRGFMGLCQAAR